MKPQKYAARRSHKENQAIHTITNDRDGGTGNGNGNNSGINSNNMIGGGDNSRGRLPPGENSIEILHQLYDRNRQHTQVKTYMDHGNGYSQRSGSITQYSKVGKKLFSFKLFQNNRQYKMTILYLLLCIYDLLVSIGFTYISCIVRQSKLFMNRV